MVIKNLTTDLKVEKIEDQKKFKITLTKVDLSDPENVLDNLRGLREAIESQQKELDTMDVQFEAKKEATKKMMSQNVEIEKAIAEAEKQANDWIEVKPLNKPVEMPSQTETTEKK